MFSKKNSVIILGLVLTALAQFVPLFSGETNLFSSRFSGKDLTSIIMPASDYFPYAQYADRDFWDNQPETLKFRLITAGERFLKEDWASLPASVFLEYTRTGDRGNYQELVFGRRKKLAGLVMAECLEGKGRFLDQIINGVWLTCEESFWDVPAHLGLQKAGFGLPDVTEPTVDIFAAETAGLLAWTIYLLGDELDTVNPLIRKRVIHEIDRRIITPNLERSDFWWMGYERPSVNNHNPWICTNWLAAVLLTESDQNRRMASIEKILAILDHFVSAYPDDGGCEEGPAYWERGAGSLFKCLELLFDASKGRINLYENPHIRNMGLYIARVHISNQFYINFADAPARTSVPPELVFQYGRRSQDTRMKAYGALLAQQADWPETINHGQFGGLAEFLFSLALTDSILTQNAAAPQFADVWFPDTQIFAARSGSTSETGLYLAAKGGHNGESHNHNDVGHFIVFKNGAPLIIDAGVETYTAKTFSKDRYTLWNNQSAYHSLPTINGTMQKDGKSFRATDCQYQQNKNWSSLTLDIAAAYPEEARVKTWNREIVLNRDKNILLKETYELIEIIEPPVLFFLTPNRPKINSDHILLNGNDGEDGILYFQENQFDASFEQLDLQNSAVQKGWGDVFRIILRSKILNTKNSYAVRIE